MTAKSNLPQSDAALRARIRQEVLQEMSRAVFEAGRSDGHMLILSDYEVANLRAALQATGYGSVYRSPLQVLNNGDWLGQIVYKLQGLAEGQKPNADAGELARRANEWRGRP